MVSKPPRHTVHRVPLGCPLHGSAATRGGRGPGASGSRGAVAGPTTADVF